MLAWIGLFARKCRWRAHTHIRWDYAAGAICLSGLGWQFHQLAHGEPSTRAAIYCLGVASVAAIGSPWMRKSIFVPLLLLAYFVAGVLILRQTSHPLIDVFEVTRASCQAMSRGENPYAIDFPDIYTARPDWEKAFYPPGFVYDGRVHFGYQYMPLSFSIAYIGHVLGGDFRLGNLLAITAAGGFLAYARRGRWSTAAAVLLLSTPRGYYVLQEGWSEPAVVVCLALVIFCACRKRSLLPWAVGLLMVSKQHMFLAAPALLLLLPRPWQWRTAVPFLLKATLIGAIVTLPLALWNPHAFWRSAGEVQIKNPFRADSLNFAAAWVRAGHAPLPGGLAFAVALLAAIIAIYWAGYGPAAFAAAMAVIYLSFFAFAKQAFCNYYFLTIAALCCAAAAIRMRKPCA